MRYGVVGQVWRGKLGLDAERCGEVMQVKQLGESND